MHRSMRLLSLELPSLPASRPLYVCFNCRHEPLPRPFAAHQIRHNSGSTSVTERIRRKLWGTDRPPGLKDPYGGRGILERRLGRKGQSDADAQQVSEADIDSDEFADIAPPDDYIPATTWDDLERIGHLGKWSDYSPKKEDTYKRFMAKERIWGTDVDNAARMAAVEICLLHKLNKPPTSACHVLEHDKDIQKLLMKCRIDSNAAADWGSAVVFPGREAKEILIYVFDQIGDLGKKHNEKTAQRPQQQGTLGSKEVKAGLFHVDTFKALSLNDPTIRFAFMKRFSQLTGHYLPDPLIHSSATIEAALQYVHDVITPKPKLAVRLSNDPTLRKLPNVKIFDRRHKPADTDYALGRKKVIDAALRERGLLE